MTEYISSAVRNSTGFITIDRPRALNSLSLDMVRAITRTLLGWRDNPQIHAVVIRSSTEKAFCAGGDIRFFYEAGHATPQSGSTLLEDFFTEEYALNHLAHHYPKPYIALMDGIVMGGGMGLSQSGPGCRLRVVTERSRLAMPEVNIGLFPDVGGSHFLSRTPGRIGTYLGLTGDTVTAADALYAGLADVFVPASELSSLSALLETVSDGRHHEVVRNFAAAFQHLPIAAGSTLALERSLIDRHFSYDTVAEIAASLAGDAAPFAQKAWAVMKKRSPLMMCVTLEQLRRGATMNLADCLRMERTMVRRCFEHGEILEGVRAMVIDKDNAPGWNPATLDQVTPAMVAPFFQSAWPAHAHPLRELA